MRRSTFRISIVSGLILLAVEASAQSAFVEGHVFNVNSGKPLPRAVVEIFENVTAGPVPIRLGEDITDGNGFYEVEVTEFLGFAASIQVTCRVPARGPLPEQIYRGSGSVILREDTLRRDIYIRAPADLTRCYPSGIVLPPPVDPR